jgi:prolyl oligopeptidase
MKEVKKLKTLPYPQTKKGDVVDTYFGTQVPDPYRWLENDTAQDTKAWVIEENKVTQHYLNQIPFREKIKNRLEEIWNYPKFGTPFKKGERYFYYKNDGLQNQYVLYVLDSLDGKAEVLLDPNTLSDDGTVALSTMSISKDGKYLAYAISRSGSDWQEIYVREIESKKDLDDHVEWMKFSGISWKDNGFYYSRYDAPVGGKEFSNKNEYHKVYYHRLGDSQEKDVLIYKNDKFPLRNYYAGTTEDETMLILTESESTSGNSLFVKRYAKDRNFIKIADGFDFNYDIIDNLGSQLLVKTNDGASKYRLVLIDPDHPAKENWKEIIPEKEEVMGSLTLLGGKLIVSYMKDAYSQAFIYSVDGKLLDELKMPGIGTFSGMSGKKEETTGFYSFTSFTSPATIYHYDIETNTSKVYRQSEILFDFDKFETKQIFYSGKDGTKIPMFIVHKKGIKMDGSNPTLLYAYGGFNISLTPSFSITRLVLLENGFVFAMPNIRGGGEYGEEWHKAGTKTQKQNVFDDFIAAAEYLIDKKYTSSRKLAIQGGSNGGLLMGACLTQRPDLYGVVLPAVGVLDMLRYHNFTIGWAWATDYGRSDDSKEMFEYLYGYSPLHNIHDGVCYPATLVTTGDHDDRVVPAHSFKFIARLQAAQACDNPTLIRIATKAGHGAGKPTSKIIEEYADLWSFTMWNLDVKPIY